MSYKYAAQNVDPEITAKALGRDVPVKPKFGINVAKAIRGKQVAAARLYLENVVAMKQAVPFRVHKTNIKHRKGGMGPGKYPVAVAAAMLRILNDAASNAEYKGLDPDKMRIWHVVTHMARPLPGSMPRAQGRATQWNKQVSHIEIVLKNEEEKEE
ncbi:MAG: 50S ribosomal protein L22 [Candidatus Thermoplasmatota archaeon]